MEGVLPQQRQQRERYDSIRLFCFQPRGLNMGPAGFELQELVHTRYGNKVDYKSFDHACVLCEHFTTFPLTMFLQFARAISRTSAFCVNGAQAPPPQFHHPCDSIQAGIRWETRGNLALFAHALSSTSTFCVNGSQAPPQFHHPTTATRQEYAGRRRAIWLCLCMPFPALSRSV